MAVLLVGIFYLIRVDSPLVARAYLSLLKIGARKVLIGEQGKAGSDAGLLCFYKYSSS